MIRLSATLSSLAAAPPRILLLLAALPLLLLALHTLAMPRLAQVHLETMTEDGRSILLPDMEKTRGITRYSILLHWREWQQTRLQLASKDGIRELTVNDKRVRVPQVSGYEHVIELDIGPWLRPGSNRLVLETEQRGLTIGPPVFHRDRWFLSDWLGCLLTAACACLIYAGGRRLAGAFAGGLLTTAFALMVFTLSRKGFMWYPQDLLSHIQYMLHVAVHASVPNPAWAWEFYHPPLYYILQALALRVANRLDSFDTLTALRLLNALLFCGFLILSSRLLRNALTTRAYCAVLPLLMFYPMSMAYALRIDGHALFYLCYAACAWQLWQWVETARPARLAGALILLGVGIAARSNMLILLPPFAAALIYMLCRHGRSAVAMRRAAALAAVLALCLGTAANFGRTAYWRHHNGADMPYIVGNIHMIHWDWLSNEPANYLTFDWDGYWRYGMSYDYNFQDKQNFWSAMLRSSLINTDDWRRGTPALPLLARGVLLALIAYVLAAAALYPALWASRGWWGFLIALASGIGALMVNRYERPFVSSGDMRYIFPVLAAFCGMAGMAVQQHANRGRRFYAAAGGALCWTMAGGTLLLWCFE